MKQFQNKSKQNTTQQVKSSDSFLNGETEAQEGRETCPQAGRWRKDPLLLISMSLH